MKENYSNGYSAYNYMTLIYNWSRDGQVTTKIMLHFTVNITIKMILI